MYTNHVNPVALENQDKLSHALLETMQTKPFERITVTEICRLAGLERVTFYRHFENKDDVIDYYLDRQMLMLLASLPSHSTLRHNLTAIFEWAYAERKNLNALMDNHMTGLLSLSLHRKVFTVISANLADQEITHLPHTPHTPPADDLYMVNAMFGLIFGLLSAWRMDDYRLPAHALVQRMLLMLGVHTPET